MSAWFLTNYNRSRVLIAIAEAPLGARVTLDDGDQRTNPQNKLMWKLLSFFADQVVHGDRKYDADTWKCILLKAFGKELQFVPSLDGTSVVALGYRSSLLLVEEMSQFIEFIYSEGARIGVVFDEELPEPPIIYLPTPQRALAPP
jgi:NinB protein